MPDIIRDLAKSISELAKRVRRLEAHSVRDRVYACRVYNDANFTHNSTGNYLAITFNSERSDSYAMHDTSTNPSRITVPIAGWYYVGGHLRFTANATGIRQIAIRFGGSTYIAIHSDNNPDGTYTSVLSVSTVYYLTASDYVELVAFQNSGGNLDIVATANYSPEFAVMRLNR
jgi:hypothetical protein